MPASSIASFKTPPAMRDHGSTSRRACSVSRVIPEPAKPALPTPDKRPPATSITMPMTARSIIERPRSAKLVKSPKWAANDRNVERKLRNPMKLTIRPM